VLVLRVAGRLDSMTSQSFQDKLQRHIDEGIQRFVLDMSGLAFISSMGLRSLILAARQSKVVLCGMTEFVSRIVDLGGIARVVVIRETLDEAVASAAGMA
jgi:anti-anti-sigma factor